MSPANEPISTPAQRPIVAVFDFDGTITYVDSFIPFLREAAGTAGFLIRLPLLLLCLAGLKCRLWNRAQGKAFAIGLFLKGRSLEELTSVSRRYIVGRLKILENPRALRCFHDHIARGHRVIVLSASPELYLREWVAQFPGVEIIATRLEEKNGRLTGRLASPNCRGEEKPRRLASYLGPLERSEIYAYGDEPADWDLMKLTEHPNYRAFDSAQGRARKALMLRALWRALLFHET